MLKAVGVIIAGAGLALTVGAWLYFSSAQGAALTQRVESHMEADKENRAAIRSTMHSFQVEQRTVHDDIILIGERLRVQGMSK